MNERMNMATKVIMVQEIGTPDEIESCINEKGQWHEPYCDLVLLKHGVAPFFLYTSEQMEQHIKSSRLVREWPGEDQDLGEGFYREWSCGITTFDGEQGRVFHVVTVFQGLEDTEILS